LRTGLSAAPLLAKTTHFQEITQPGPETLELPDFAQFNMLRVRYSFVNYEAEMKSGSQN